MPVKNISVLMAAILLPVMPVCAQTVTPEQMFGITPYESPSCNTPDYHELDFMHGTWALKILKDGKWIPGGYSVHRPALGGCISFEYGSFENWGDFYMALTGREGLAGFAINTFDRQAGNWQQIWVDDSGTIITTFRGRKFADGMRFVGHAPGDRGTELQKFEYQITGEDIREFTYDMSTDGGRNWTQIARIQMIRQQEKPLKPQ